MHNNSIPDVALIASGYAAFRIVRQSTRGTREAHWHGLHWRRIASAKAKDNLMHGLSTIEAVKEAHIRGVYLVGFCGLRLPKNIKDASHV